MTPNILVQLVTLANKHGERMNALSKDEQMAAFETLVREAEMAWAVWQDEGRPNGVGVILVKGGRNARRMEDRRRLKGKVAAVPCRNRFEAEAVNDAFGDGSTRIETYAAPPPEVVPHLASFVREQKRRDADFEKAVAEGSDNRKQVEAGHFTVGQFFEELDIVRGVFPEGDSLVVETLKGNGRLMLSVQAKKNFVARVGSLSFASRSEAEEAGRRFGDGRSMGNPDLWQPARDWAFRQGAEPR